MNGAFWYRRMGVCLSFFYITLNIDKKVRYYNFMLLCIFFRKDQVIPHLTMYRTSWFDELVFFEKIYRARHLRGFEPSSVNFNLK